jgi:putative nucleotidyltransferase with HDIG domain
MAIDAKDQVTHGHIRRVQAQATRLAGEVGVRDVKLLKAIEAAALLHDMGKLAVPEYILNKPGRLSEAEFERMKLHASVGADILCAIDFPYPVVPIVRHHHENWNGSGYPGGLSGTQIPIGARLLAVVDCFDALTSDRPYRLRLSDEDALRILLERRGSMYDPLIVDTFVKLHTSSPLESVRKGPPSNVLDTIALATRPAPLQLRSTASLAEAAAPGAAMLPAYELASALSGPATFADTTDTISRHLSDLMPCSLCVFYWYDGAKDDLQAMFASGDGAVVVKGLRIALGQRLSGWVAANRQTIVNSDPALDFGDAARSMAPQLGSCLSTPLLLNDALVGVLSVYSTGRNAFREEHRNMIEILGRQLAPTFQRAIESEATILSDQRPP